MRQRAPPRPLWRTLAHQFKSPLIYILFVAALLADGAGHPSGGAGLLAGGGGQVPPPALLQHSARRPEGPTSAPPVPAMPRGTGPSACSGLAQGSEPMNWPVIVISSGASPPVVEPIARRSPGPSIARPWRKMRS